MRAFIVFSALIIANAINPDQEIDEGTGSSIIVVIIFGVLFDVIDLIKRGK